MCVLLPAPSLTSVQLPTPAEAPDYLQSLLSHYYWQRSGTHQCHVHMCKLHTPMSVHKHICTAGADIMHSLTPYPNLNLTLPWNLKLSLNSQTALWFKTPTGPHKPYRYTHTLTDQADQYTVTKPLSVFQTILVLNSEKTTVERDNYNLEVSTVLTCSMEVIRVWFLISPPDLSSNITRSKL